MSLAKMIEIVTTKDRTMEDWIWWARESTRLLEIGVQLHPANEKISKVEFLANLSEEMHGEMELAACQWRPDLLNLHKSNKESKSNAALASGS